MSVSLAPQILAIIFNARNTDSARIRPFFRSLFGLSPMNADMSVFMAPQVRPEVRHRNTDMSVFMVCSLCSWSTGSVFMVHVVSVHGHHGSVHYNII